jgi:hypothetical protein
MLGGRGDSLQSLRERDALTGSTRSVGAWTERAPNTESPWPGRRGFQAASVLSCVFGWGKRSENVFS